MTLVITLTIALTMAFVCKEASLFYCWFFRHISSTDIRKPAKYSSSLASTCRGGPLEWQLLISFLFFHNFHNNDRMELILVSNDVELNNDRMELILVSNDVELNNDRMELILVPNEFPLVFTMSSKATSNILVQKLLPLQEGWVFPTHNTALSPIIN